MSDHYDELTLRKVYAGLEAAGIAGQEAIVHALENTRVDSHVTVQHGEELLSGILHRLTQVGFDPDSYPQAHAQGETA